MKKSRLARILGATTLTLALVSVPISASAYTFVEYWGGHLSSWQTKSSVKTTMEGSYIGGCNCINITYFAQTVTSAGIYGSAETIGGTALLQHGSYSLSARCFHRPTGSAGTSTDFVSCDYLKP